jgi:hydroxyacylglutathione hydrolase
MQHVVTQPVTPFLSADGTVEVHQIPAWRDNLVWLAICKKTGYAAVIDGPDAQATIAYIEARQINLTAILNTHTHPDHIGINRDLSRRNQLTGLRVWGCRTVAEKIPGLTDALDDGDAVELGALTGRALLTEGHINGHLSYLFGDVLFCGDALFTGGCGYLFDGPPAKMHATLQALAELPPATRVCCAHEYTEDNLRFAWFMEPDNAALADRIKRVWALRAEGRSAVPSTIGEERDTNPFIRTGSPTIIAALARHLPSHPLSTPAEVFAALRALKDRKPHRDLSDDALPI